MKAFITLLFMMFIISNINGDYSIDNFLNYLQESGYYDLFQEVKYSLGDDIAITLCKELVNSNDCEIVIKVYMAPKLTQSNTNIDRIIIEPNIISLEELKRFEDGLNRLLETYGPKFLTFKEIFLKYSVTLIKRKSVKELLILIEKLYLDYIKRKASKQGL